MAIADHGEGNGTPLQYSCLENPMDGGAWKAAVHGETKGWTRLSDFTFTFHFRALEKDMATHSSAIAWRIPGAGEPGGLPFMGSHRVRHDWSALAAVTVVIADQIRSVAQSCPTLRDPMNCSTKGLPVHTNSRSSLRLTSIKSVMPSSHLILRRPLLLLPPIPPSIRVFSNESTLCLR